MKSSFFKNEIIIGDCEKEFLMNIGEITWVKD